MARAGGGAVKPSDQYLPILAQAEKQGCVPGAMRRLAQEDLFFLLVFVLGRKDADRPWIYDRCREVQTNPDGHLDLWAREHYKSTIITFAKTIQDILNDPDITVGIFSHTRPIAKGFLRQIKRELEGNNVLKALFHDIIHADPQHQSPKWSEDDGIIVKRKTNPKEATVEAWGLVDGQPTSKHFKLLVYDDVVTRESVTTPDMIAKVTDAWALSLNLGADGGKIRTIGTRYHFNDTYKVMLDRGSVTPRIFPATDNGKDDGAPVLLDPDTLAKKRRDMGVYVFSCQMLQDPAADKAQGFKAEWLRFYSPKSLSGLNLYLLCDPAGEKKRENDYTVMLVMALGQDENYYLIDGLRDRLNLTERTERLMHFHRKYRPIRTGYEKYGKDSDIEHIKDEQDRKNYRFEIVPLGGAMPKFDRIRTLVPIFETGRMFMPSTLYFIDYEGKQRDLVNEFINDEYSAFPVSLHDDILDCMARIRDPLLKAQFPEKVTELQQVYDLGARQKYDPFSHMSAGGGR